MEAEGVRKDGQPEQATMEVGLKVVENQSGKANVGTEGSEAGTGKIDVETAWVRKAMKKYHPITVEVLQIHLSQCKIVYHLPRG